MGLGRIIANRSLNIYRKINENNMRKSQDFLKSYNLANDKSLKITIECSQYLMINSYDLFVLSYNYLTSKKTWDKILYSRILALYIIDFYDNIFPLIGKELVYEVNNFAEKNIVESLKLIGKDISKLKNESESKLRHIRNVTIAHKINQGSYLMDEIESINHKEINEFATQLTGLITKLSAQLTNILRSYVNVKNNNGT